MPGVGSARRLVDDAVARGDRLAMQQRSTRQGVAHEESDDGVVIAHPHARPIEELQASCRPPGAFRSSACSAACPARRQYFAAGHQSVRAVVLLPPPPPRRLLLRTRPVDDSSVFAVHGLRTPRCRAARARQGFNHQEPICACTGLRPAAGGQASLDRRPPTTTTGFSRWVHRCQRFAHAGRLCHQCPCRRPRRASWNKTIKRRRRRTDRDRSATPFASFLAPALSPVARACLSRA